MLDDLRARFKVKLVEPTSSTDETPVTRIYEVLVASEADRIDAVSTSLAPHLAAPAKGTDKAPNLALPKMASGVARVSEPASGVYVDVQPAGLAAAAADVADGYVVYVSARSPKEHLLRRITADGVEDFENFEYAPASPDVSYDLGLSPKVAGLRLVGNSLELLDSAGTPRLRVPSPYLVDATGARVDATLTVQGCAVDTSPAAPWGRAITAPGAAHCTLNVSWDGSKVTYPALLDPSWTTTGSMPNTQADHKGVLLASGKTLVIGPNFGHGCFLYDAPSGTWSATGSPVKQRSNAMVAVLQDGRVLLAGGYNGGTQNTAELYNPASGTWSGTGNLVSNIEQATGTLLANGKVLVAGGFKYVSSTNRNYTAESELFNPASGTWSLTGSMPSAHAQYASGLLPNGKVIVVSGVSAWPSDTGNATATVYDPSSGTWAAAGTLPAARYRHAATVLPYGGKVLASGGLNPANLARLNTTALYDPVANTWSAGPVMSVERVYHGTILLPNSKVLLAGGETNAGRTNAVDLYDPQSNTITATTGMSIPRSNFSVTVAGDPATTWPVLVAGGYTPPNNSTTATAELFDVRSPPNLVGGGESASLPPVVVDWTNFAPPTGTVSSSSSLSITAYNTTGSTQQVHIDLVAAGLDQRTVTLPAFATLTLSPGGSQAFTVLVSQLPVQSIGSESQIIAVAKPYTVGGGDTGQNAPSAALYYEFAPGYATATMHGSSGKDLDRTQPAPSATQGQLFSSMQSMLLGLATRQGRVWNASTGGFADISTFPPQGGGVAYTSYGQWAADTEVLQPAFAVTYSPPPGAPDRTICADWTARYDDGTSTDDYLHTYYGVATEYARFASAFIVYNGSDLVWSGHLNTDGCITAKMGKGSFTLHWLATASNGIATIKVTPGANGPHDSNDPRGYIWPDTPPQSIVGFTLDESTPVNWRLGTGMDSYNTRAAAVMAVVLRNPDPGFVSGTYTVYSNADTSAPCGYNHGSCGDATALYIGNVVSAGVSYHQSLRKFIIGHEFGHSIFGKLFGGSIGAIYDFANPQPYTPTTLACRCEHVTSSNNVHCLTSRELQSNAIQEGIAHFYSSKIFNDPNQSDGTFVYYKESFNEDGGAPLPPRLPVSCVTPKKWVTNHCGSGAAQLGSEWDWMTAMYNIHTVAPLLETPYSMSEIGSIFRLACSGSASGSCTGVENLRFDKPATSVDYGNSHRTPGNMSLADAACRVVAGILNGQCADATNSKYLRILTIGHDHGVDY